jgi:rod shape-determining protein MreC
MRNSRNRLLKAAIFIVASIFLLNIPFVRELAPVKISTQIVGYVLYPFQYILYKAVTGTGHVASSVATLRGAQIENEKLKEKLREERALMSSVLSVMDENRQLKELLDLKRTSASLQIAIAAEVVSRSPSNWFDIVVIDKGTADGVYGHKAVINEKGLVGKVIEAGKHSAKVMLISDPNCKISVSFKRTGDTGSASGLGMDKLRVKYIHSSAEIRQLDEAVTSGASGIFPKGIPVGRVSSVGKKDYDLFQQIVLDTAVDLSKIEKVLVLR